MFYYDIAVGTKSRGTKYTFTYSSSTSLSVGQVVEVTLKSQKAFGFIVKKSAKPGFKTAPIERTSDFFIPEHLAQATMKLAAKLPYCGAQIAKLFLPKDLKRYKLERQKILKATDLPPLNDDQSNIYKKIIDSKQSCFIFGDTGSGKTRLYAHIAKHILNEGYSVVLLEPEIGLAGFIHSELEEYFPEAIIYHSGLTAKQRQIIWQRVHDSTKPMLIIGPRSAMGLPINNLKLVITDEAHDQSYRQDGSPYLGAQNIISAICSSKPDTFYIYGTATPNVADLYLARIKHVPIHRITTLASRSSQLPDTIEVSSRENGAVSGKMLHKESVRLLSETFKQNQQAMILLNRRGSARLITCENCQNQITCPNCKHLLVYHHDNHTFRCHFCQKKFEALSSCPACGSGSLKMLAYGTKALELEVRSLFPSIEIIRVDSDSGAGVIKDNVQKIRSGGVQCIIGTQMVAKGLDLPNLKSLVVIDGSRSGGYIAEERQFQLLYQVVGRALRGHQNTNVLIQTEDSGIVVQSIVARDYERFYKYEIAERKKFSYPPFCNMMLIHFSRSSQTSGIQAAKELISDINKLKLNVEVIGPIENSTFKIGTKYNYHILVKSVRRANLETIANSIGTSWICEFDPTIMP